MDKELDEGGQLPHMVALELGSLLAMPDMVKKNTWQTQAVGFGSMRVKDITHRSWRCLSAMGFHSIFRIALAWHPQLPVPLACCPKASTAASPTFLAPPVSNLHSHQASFGRNWRWVVALVSHCQRTLCLNGPQCLQNRPSG